MLPDVHDVQPVNKEFIAYFTMEVGLSHSIPTYSGGLGILAGDLLKTYADMKMPVVGITLLNEKGYFDQHIDSDGNQIENPVSWNPNDFMVPLPNIVTVKIDGRDVKVRAWKHNIRGSTGNNISLYFLDTNIEGNSDYDRTLTSFLYGGDRKYRIAQEIVLGMGGVRMLRSLGHNIKKYHMNEGHASLLVVELLNEIQNGERRTPTLEELEKVKQMCIFTTHTPVAAGHDKFELETFKKITSNCVPDFMLKEALDDGLVNMTLFALHHSKYVNGVAKRHGEITKEMFHGYTIDSITNGVHPGTWVSLPFKRMFDKHIPGWSLDPFSLRYALAIPKQAFWNAHEEAKFALIEEINKRTNAGFHPARFTLGYARRFTAYKRPDLVLFDVERLKAIADKVGDVQIVFAGKAHAQDKQGKELLKKVMHEAKIINEQNSRLKVVFLEGYDLRLAQVLVSGCDAWLNTPQRPFEASGTSGMKAALNGVPQISTLDGWWLEGHIENVTGWSLGPSKEEPGFGTDLTMDDEARDLYEKLENKIIPVFYGNNEKWIGIMRHCVAINGSFFNTKRMAEQYISNAYFD
ncbi:MAG: alpha-glucan family phosphorylase [Candidatus Woesearchaeota archaeon]